jgi:S-adenosylmethionine synthetase
VSYAIGVAKPMGIFVDTYGTTNVDLSDGEIAKKLEDIFDMRPAAIIDRLKLKNPIYQETAAYGHMGRTPETKSFTFDVEGQSKELTLETFTWEKLDYVDDVKRVFSL